MDQDSKPEFGDRTPVELIEGGEKSRLVANRLPLQIRSDLKARPLLRSRYGSEWSADMENPALDQLVHGIQSTVLPVLFCALLVSCLLDCLFIG